ncbi:lipid II:glycine glycyltransferase FemX [Heyndrickxia oleronia]|jgi:hypothetical protein|uniref:lipid II:glycine glycyltransferase FemX n=1 Tax=Heyndrickxia oleronia TaxID=38875 RepID=UPI00242B31A7|nr:GNAT family N-acetyltransferase [Heyndrickxia oleronia]MCI1590688.1 GNAT family N-acetyltransferase [Heyndrickxia oleronia]MCI1612123.1 GNAT family N-acetyltransferase [Heyndrickxia oleronia]MCI1759832.1 GNAT family N-acetyltransferase [Heyndrickxia oleronia]
MKNEIILGELYILNSNESWNNYAGLFNQIDIYYSHEYAELFAEAQGGVPEAVYFENIRGRVFYPYIKREIPLKKGYFDIITPYGYGGPILEGDRSIIKTFHSLFKNYCLNSNIVTETIGLHPLINNIDYIKEIMKVDYIRKTVAVDLTPPINEIRNNYSQSNKRNIRKAIRTGVNVNISTNNSDIKRFIDLYYETMDRNQAAQFYYFKPRYFYKQLESTNLSKSFLLIAQYNGEIIGAVLFVVGKEYAHYHLGASKTEFLHLRPNNLLFDTMIEFSKNLGVKKIHLGGGYSDDDSLFRFKSSFSNYFYTYYIGKNIINHNIYNELIIETKREKSSKFFPEYR